jgi:beta-fructofuranosidase
MVGPGVIWECPQLLAIGDRWLLVVSWDDGVGVPPPGPDGTRPRHQGVVAYVGDLDLSGTVPRFVAATETVLDHGPDFYAPQLVADGERVLAWGWAWEGRGSGTNHRSADDIAAAGWAGTLTFPREVVIDASGAARCLPARELIDLVDEPLAADQVDGGWEVCTPAPAWTVAAAGGVLLDLVDGATGQTRSVWGEDASGPTRVFVDGSIVEAFTACGSTTLRAYPADGECWRVRSAGPLEAATLRAR